MFNLSFQNMAQRLFVDPLKPSLPHVNLQQHTFYKNYQHRLTNYIEVKKVLRETHPNVDPDGLLLFIYFWHDFSYYFDHIQESQSPLKTFISQICDAFEKMCIGIIPSHIREQRLVFSEFKRLLLKICDLLAQIGEIHTFKDFLIRQSVRRHKIDNKLIYDDDLEFLGKPGVSYSIEYCLHNFERLKSYYFNLVDAMFEASSTLQVSDKTNYTVRTVTHLSTCQPAKITASYFNNKHTIVISTKHPGQQSQLHIFYMDDNNILDADQPIIDLEQPIVVSQLFVNPISADVFISGYIENMSALAKIDIASQRVCKGEIIEQEPRYDLFLSKNGHLYAFDAKGHLLELEFSPTNITSIELRKFIHNRFKFLDACYLATEKAYKFTLYATDIQKVVIVYTDVNLYNPTVKPINSSLNLPKITKICNSFSKDQHFLCYQLQDQVKTLYIYSAHDHNMTEFTSGKFIKDWIMLPNDQLIIAFTDKTLSLYQIKSGHPLQHLQTWSFSNVVNCLTYCDDSQTIFLATEQALYNITLTQETEN